MSSSPENGHCKVTDLEPDWARRVQTNQGFHLFPLERRVCVLIFDIHWPFYQDDSKIEMSKHQVSTELGNSQRSVTLCLGRAATCTVCVWEPAPGLLENKLSRFSVCAFHNGFFYSCQNKRNTKTVTDHLGRLYECSVKPAGFPYCLSSTGRYCALWIFLFGLGRLQGTFWNTLAREPGP